MIDKKYRLSLAALLKLYKEVSTDRAMLVAEADEIEVGTEVFVKGEEGMEPAQDGEYTDTVENKIYVVAGGTVTEIREKEIENKPAEEGTQENAEENMENNEGSDNGEGNDNNNTADDTNSTSEVEAEVETLKAENEALKAKVAELEATVSDLEDQVAAYKAKEEETAPAAEEAEKFASQKTGDPKLDKKMKAAAAIRAALK